MVMIEILAAGALAAAVLQIALMLRPVGTVSLPDPAKLGLPMAGNASQQAAHAALSRGGGAPRPKFRT
jgi:hypothetical protein